MVILITGASHTGKTLLAQKLLEKYHYPYLSVDHLKMGLIRSQYTDLSVSDTPQLTAYLWPIIREMIKTAIENGQDLIVEGCYIPFDWQAHFSADYLEKIRYLCLVMSEEYILKNFEAICRFGNVIEQRLDDSGLSKSQLIEENRFNLEQCRKFGCPYILIDGDYSVDVHTLQDKLIPPR